MSADASEDPRLVLGWKEWIALPELGLPAVMAKVDTGARTCALHAAWIETYGPATAPMVRFGVHPVRRKADIEIVCTARAIDRRMITSSNGERELRYVIRTPLRIGEHVWPIEVTLTNRGSMSYRMLLGRSALAEGVCVDASTSFRQPRLSHRLYRSVPRRRAEPNALHIAVLTTRPEQPSSQLLRRAATARGHRMTFIDRRRLSLFVDADAPAILADGAGLACFDAVISRGSRGASSFTIAAVRQFELMGAVALNPADALSHLREPLELSQRLAKAHIAAPAMAASFAASHRKPRAEDHLVVDAGPSPLHTAVVRIIVVGDRAVAAVESEAVETSALDDERRIWKAADLAALTDARALAEQAARALGLGFAAIDVVPAQPAPFVAGVSATPPLAAIQRLTGVAIAEAVIAHIEAGTLARGLGRPRT